MAKQDGDRISKQFLCNIWKKRNERPSAGGVSIRNRNGAPSRKGCVVNGQMTKASNKGVRPPHTPMTSGRESNGQFLCNGLGLSLGANVVTRIDQ